MFCIPVPQNAVAAAAHNEPAGVTHCKAMLQFCGAVSVRMHSGISVLQFTQQIPPHRSPHFFSRGMPPLAQVAGGFSGHVL